MAKAVWYTPHCVFKGGGSFDDFYVDIPQDGEAVRILTKNGHRFSGRWQYWRRSVITLGRKVIPVWEIAEWKHRVER